MANINNTESQTVDTFLTLTLTLQPQHFMVGSNLIQPALSVIKSGWAVCVTYKIYLLSSKYKPPQNCIAQSY